MTAHEGEVAALQALALVAQLRAALACVPCEVIGVGATALDVHDQHLDSIDFTLERAAAVAKASTGAS